MSADTIAAYRAAVRDMNERIQSSEAYLIHAAGKDRRMEQRYAAKLRRERDAVLARLRELEGSVAA